MRGARQCVVGQHAHDRIIPADAGSTIIKGKKVEWQEDHPRGCGEHQKSVGLEELGRGSSPRMRGAHLKILAIPTI